MCIVQWSKSLLLLVSTMGGQEEACAKCNRNCLLIHKLGEARKVSSFFKVMFGKRFSEVLFLPPKFSKTLSFHGGKRMYLQNSNGQKWNVAVSDENGSHAFQNGWSEFVKDHDIELGDFVVFHYIMGTSHFAVQIFGRSGCEKLASSATKNYQNKRMKIARDALDLHHPYDKFVAEPPAKKNPNASGVSRPHADVVQKRDKSENNEKSSFTMAGKAPSHENIAQGLNGESATNFLEDLSFMLDRNMGFAKGDKEDLFDLSIFEIPEEKAAPKEVENPTASVDTKKFQVAEGNTFSENEELCLLKKESSSLPSGYLSTDVPPNSSMTEKPADRPHKSEFLVPPGRSLAPISFPFFTSNSDLLNKLNVVEVGSLGSWDWTAVPNILNHRAVAFGLEDPGPLVDGWWRELGNPATTLTPTPTPMLPGPMPEIESYEMAGRTGVVKQEPTEIIEDFGIDVVADTSLAIPSGNANLSSNVEPGVIVKCEPIDLFDSSSKLVANVTCLVQANSESFLELPEPLPIRAYRAAKLEKKMVILHDQAGRQWPVLYHQRFGFKVLASGWAAFRKANDIQQGDECIFTLENRDEGIFAVTVHHS
ncbi:hypothetical protein Cgig2_020269 [Carnegiea gigantea]|uniref:TF-B3 domain-containing protein n=1 Tax=Carnegiea gigantea TaxID=171969 RepID=A0A9Q1KY05_9CARY|nr:hypothetical protein Cgig2_020269 [Carnegiea gigantea]